jgi:alkanesulfonate monooxygenase SsuD/methylene tetrahydromethanopterin reductase-like flavin-dependent oxidoreductase (luciferase family)
MIYGDPDTVGEQMAESMTLGVDGFTINLPANGHIPGRVELLGETVAPIVG